MNITQVGIDLAKLVFQVHGVDSRGKVAVRKQLKRSQVAEFFAQLAPCLIGMEACGGAHFWARKLMEFGHTVKLIAPQFVKPYVKTNKNDAADAEAICEAVGRPNMRFVPIKNVEQQALLGLHRVRQGFVAARTAQANQIRGLLTEFGLVIPVGIRSIERKVPEFLEDGENGLSGVSSALLLVVHRPHPSLSRHGFIRPPHPARGTRLHQAIACGTGHDGGELRWDGGVSRLMSGVTSTRSECEASRPRTASTEWTMENRPNGRGEIHHAQA